MTEKEINQIIEEEKIQKIIQEEEFHFSKGTEALQRWLSFSVSEELKEDIIRLSSDYAQFQEIAEINPEIGKIKDMLFEIISYCDIRAKEKHVYNRYDDKRCLAEASVRMGDWLAHLVKYKLVSNEPSMDDLRQMYAYHHYFSAKKVALLYPGKNPEIQGSFVPIDQKEQNQDLNQEKKLELQCGLLFSQVDTTVKEWQREIGVLINNWAN